MMATKIQQLEDDVPFDIQDNEMGMMFMSVWTPAIDTVPQWWSTARDIWLQNFWKQHDPTKIAVETFTNKALSIQLNILPKNTLIDAHVEQAERFSTAILRQSGLYKGFDVEFEKFVQDYLTTDNGGFMLIMGNGNADGPILGAPSGLFHLDSLRCSRTNNPEFPVVYHHTDGTRYKLHYTRVIFFSNLSSSRSDMNGVGVCAVSCELDAARELRDIVIHSQEKMGTRPNRDILYAETGATIGELQLAIQHGQQKMDSEGLKTFAKTLLLAPKAASGTLRLGKIELSSTPDGFNRKDLTLINMALIAAAFGLDLRDLSMNLVSSQTRGDAEVQDRKGRGKGVGTLLDKFQKELNLKFLPPHLYANFDNQDDEQDHQQATIWNIRSQARERDLTSGALTPRVARQQMLRLGEITSEEFEYMELLDGRLPNGLDVYSLFSVMDQQLQPLLDIGVSDPYSDRASLSLIRMKINEAHQVISTTRNQSNNSKARQALAALLKLEAQEVALQEQERMDAEAETQAAIVQQQADTSEDIISTESDESEVNGQTDDNT
jgi:hypothetical protein